MWMNSDVNTKHGNKEWKGTSATFLREYRNMIIITRNGIIKKNIRRKRGRPLTQEKSTLQTRDFLDILTSYEISSSRNDNKHPTNIRVGSVTGYTPYELVYDRLLHNPIYMGFLERENEVMSWSIIIRRLQRDRQQLIQDILHAQTLNSRRCRFRNMLMNAMRGRVISKPVKTSIQASRTDSILTFRSR